MRHAKKFAVVTGADVDVTCRVYRGGPNVSLFCVEELIEARGQRQHAVVRHRNSVSFSF